jgi:pyrroline-5-carboxylate reductase
MKNTRIGFIGSGKMATALIKSILDARITTNKNIITSDKNSNNLIKIKKAAKINVTTNNKDVVKKADIIFLAVKPQDIRSVLQEIRKEVTKKHLIVSIAAGIKLKFLQSILKRKKIIRVMPNINCLVGEMAAGFSAGKHATKKDISNVSEILSSGGVAFYVDEKLIDALSVISGSGPAFFAYFIQSFAEEGIKKGIPRKIAYDLAAKTALGTGKMLLDTDFTTKDVIKMVTSKKGTTLEGLKVLDKSKAKKIITKAYNAAYKRSKELGK